jgi:hypothetical protein
MIINSLQGQYPDADKIIYAAADRVYFDQYARPLIVSANRNTPHYHVHIHVYDPSEDQLKWAQLQPNLTVSWEEVNHVFLRKTASNWPKRKNLSNNRQSEMQKKSKSLLPHDFLKLVSNTYYACARFVRLNQILKPTMTCLSIDVDGLIRKNFSMEFDIKDIYLYEKPKDHSHLAGALLFQPHTGSQNFLNEYADRLLEAIENRDLYWFLDQVVLDDVVTRYHKGLLPMSYIDWSMKPDSAIWSAKGKRKELSMFVEELKKYQS